MVQICRGPAPAAIALANRSRVLTAAAAANQFETLAGEMHCAMKEVSRFFSVACVYAALSLAVAVSAESSKAVLDMGAGDVRQLLARIGVVASAVPMEPSYDGAALVDFIRWYESMPPIARFIDANNRNACKAWASVARYMESQQQSASASPDAFLEWCAVLTCLFFVIFCHAYLSCILSTCGLPTCGFCLWRSIPLRPSWQQRSEIFRRPIQRLRAFKAWANLILS